MMDGEPFRRTLAHRSVWISVAIVVVLWIFQMESHPIGKPLSPVFYLVFAGFFELRPTPSWSFLAQMAVFWLWFAVYVYVVAVVLAAIYRGLRAGVDAANEART
ncbi:hypothetical protein SAMN05216559_4214 [Halomicrobium zhouii]|uniref:Uncharacterized protein n=1 Tax=Halomicrobium zhouii TaxID=767519 RepID=A0A1I6MBX8_9EURY|nr:hypothetical protein [Halomicrobium zhouii]SFS13171.1 hypothetical protein SAMN05216559_4214 [Halomicrobium zhouii]